MSEISSQSGLSTTEVTKRQKQFGANVWLTPKRYSIPHIIWSQFHSPLIGILLVASVITLVMQDYADTIVIWVTVILNTVLGFFQEYKAEKDLEALASILKPMTTVIRGGKREELPVAFLVPGDLVLIDEGSTIPADGVVIESQQLGVSEALLTGEADLIIKTKIEGFKENGNENLGKILGVFQALKDRKQNGLQSSLYAGSTVISGSGKMVVARIGGETELGQIAQLIAHVDERPTPLQRRLAKFSTQLAAIFGMIALVIFAWGLLVGQELQELMRISVALAVAAMPEGLMISVTMVLAVSMRRILQKRALVRKLVVAEVLGSVGVICSDKTGTLTEGLMQVINADWTDEARGLKALLVATDVKDPLELMLKAYARHKVASEDKRLDRWPFDSKRRFSATLTDKGWWWLGAPETILQGCELSQNRRQFWETKARTYMTQGYRVIAVAGRQGGAEKKITHSLLAKKADFLGLVTLYDPIRRGVAQVVKRANGAGIELKVITGDSVETAKSLMDNIGDKVLDQEIITGAELDELSETILDRQIGALRLFARITPAQKLKIVASLQRVGLVVAMTGDGVNDAPALKKADIGIVVSQASDVSKETADLVLLDDNLGTIIAAVEEGRNVYRTVQKIILYLLSDSMAEVLVVAGSLIFNLPLPLTALQILWINLVNDGLPTIALTVEPKARGLLKEKPRDREAPLVTPFMAWVIASVSILSGMGVLAVFSRYLAGGISLPRAQTMAFTFLAVNSLIYVFSTRALERPIWRSRILKNLWLIGAVIIGFGAQLVAVYWPPMQQLLGTVPLGIKDWGVISLLAVFVLLMVEGFKAGFLVKRVS